MANNPWATKNPPSRVGQVVVSQDDHARLDVEAPVRMLGSRAEASRFDQTDLIATGCEFPTLIALHNNAAAGFDPDHPGTNPAQGC